MKKSCLSATTLTFSPAWFDFAFRGTSQARIDCDYIRVSGIGAASGKAAVYYAGASHSFVGLFDPL